MRWRTMLSLNTTSSSAHSNDTTVQQSQVGQLVPMNPVPFKITPGDTEILRWLFA
jgi:hypothetical protein